MAGQIFVEFNEINECKIKETQMLRTLVPINFPCRTYEDANPIVPVSACIFPQQGKKHGEKAEMPQPACQCWGHCLLLPSPSCYLPCLIKKGLERWEGQKSLFWQYCLNTCEAGERSAEASELDSLNLQLNSVYCQHNSQWSFETGHIKSLLSSNVPLFPWKKRPKSSQWLVSPYVIWPSIPS